MSNIAEVPGYRLSLCDLAIGPGLSHSLVDSRLKNPRIIPKITPPLVTNGPFSSRNDTYFILATPLVSRGLTSILAIFDASCSHTQRSANFLAGSQLKLAYAMSQKG